VTDKHCIIHLSCSAYRQCLFECINPY